MARRERAPPGPGQRASTKPIRPGAIDAYREVSPFALAWVCFRLGVLWGELAPEAQPGRAGRWYRQAIDHVPGYVKARIHLSELLADEARYLEARELLLPALASGDPEVDRRLADVATGLGHANEAEEHLQRARGGFERLVDLHPLAFADHAAEFYLGSGDDAPRAFELAKMDLANLPTLKAFESAHAAAIAAADASAAQRILALARERWAATPAFRYSPLAAVASNHKEGCDADRS